MALMVQLLQRKTPAGDDAAGALGCDCNGWRELRALVSQQALTQY